MVSTCRSLVVAAALGTLFAPASAGAHGALENHDGLVWCGDTLAASTDGGLLLVQGAPQRQVSLPAPARLLRYAPGCRQLAVVAGDRVLVVEPGGATTDLGPLPQPFSSPRFAGDLKPSIAWAPSGKRFAVAAVAYGAYDDGLLLYDVASRKVAALSLPAQVILTGAILLDDDTAIVAAKRLNAGGTNLYRTNVSGHALLSPTLFSEVAFGESPPAIVADHVGGGVVQVDPASGAERSVHATGHLVAGGLSQDRAKALLRFDDRGAQPRYEVVPLSGGPGAPLHLSPVGIMDVADLGLAPDGRFVVRTEPLKVKVALDSVDPKTSPRRLLTAANGSAAHIRVSPSGNEAALFVQVGGCTPGAPISNAQTYLWMLNLDGPPKPQRVALVSRSRDNCTVEH